MPVPVRLTSSLPITPNNAAVPDSVAAVVPSYVLPAADRPVIVRPFADTVLDGIAAVTFVAPVDENVTSPE